ncbi:MAG: DUF1987 domain-containing protein [Cytophagales bacterium]|nr:MAG: DUF1987 domain-containing protein [Cytophagales bacterium]
MRNICKKTAKFAKNVIHIFYMKTFTVEKTPRTPLIHFDFEKGTFEISGTSIPEDADVFYASALEHFERFLNHKLTNPIKLIFKFVYFNTSTSNYIISFLKLIKAKAPKQYYTVEWHYEQEDEDMLETGKHFEAVMEIPFKFQEVELF